MRWIKPTIAVVSTLGCIVIFVTLVLANRSSRGEENPRH